MSTKRACARPYAKALSQVAGVNQNYEEWSVFLHFLSMIVQDAQVLPLLRNPLHSVNRIAEWLYDICQSKCPTGGKEFLFLLASKHRLEVLPFIFDLFEKTRLSMAGKIAVEVITAQPLLDTQKGTVISQLEKMLGNKLEVKYRIDETLLGGFVARAGDRVIDTSLRGRLAELKESLIIHD